MSTQHLYYNNFIHNKYFKWYSNIIEKSSHRNIYNPQLHEKHHALPQSLGGTELVILSFKEHYICHELLTRFTKNKDKMKMCFALHTFFHFNYHRPSIKRGVLYENHKSIFHETCKSRTPVTKKELFTFKNKSTNVIFEGTRNDFKDFSDLTNQEIYNLISKNKNNICWNSKNWGIYNTTFNCFSYDLPRKTSKHKRIVCEHCGKSISGGNYNRWHGKNCKVINPDNHNLKIQQIKILNKLSF